MAYSKTQVRSQRWRQTVSGVTVATLGLQGAAANAIDVPSAVFPADSRPTDTFITIAETSPAEPATSEPEVVLIPRFSALGWRPLLSTSRQESPVSLSVERLKQHRRELHRRSNEVESQLLTIQQLLSMQSYGNSFADKLLSEDEFYQSKLQKLTKLEAEIHSAIEDDNQTQLRNLQHRLQQMDEDLRILAQQQLQQYIEQAQSQSLSSLWQEPMYNSSLQWLMDHTHERHSLKARQRTLAQTMVAMAAE